MANKNTKDKETLIIENEQETVQTVKKKKFRVISYNPKSKILVVERNEKLYQCDGSDYDGVSKEIELDIE